MDTRRILFLLCDQKTAGAPFTPQVALKANGKRLESVPMTNFDKDIWMAIASVSGDHWMDLRFCTSVSGGMLTTLEENWTGIDQSLLLQGDVVVRQENRRSPAVITPIAVQNMNMCFFNLASKDVSSATTIDVLGNSPGLGSWQPECKPVAFHVDDGLSCVPARIAETSVQFKLTVSLKWKTHLADDSWTDWTTGLRWEPRAFQNKCIELPKDSVHVHLVISEWGDNSIRIMDVPVYSVKEVAPAPVVNRHRLQRLKLIQETIDRLTRLTESEPTHQDVIVHTTSEILHSSDHSIGMAIDAKVLARDVSVCTVSKREEELRPTSDGSRRPGIANRIRQFFRRVVSKRAL